jgi:hypothetical protein
MKHKNTIKGRRHTPFGDVPREGVWGQRGRESFVFRPTHVVSTAVVYNYKYHQYSVEINTVVRDQVTHAGSDTRR